MLKAGVMTENSALPSQIMVKAILLFFFLFKNFDNTSLIVLPFIPYIYDDSFILLIALVFNREKYVI